MKPLVLMIEDDPQIRRFLRAALAAENYQFHEALTAEEGIAQAAARQPDLVLLDLGLPDRDGLEVIRGIRLWSQMPIVVLSARGQEKDKIAALDLGADDYVAKPFAVGELPARIRAALRRAAPVAADGSDTVIRFGDVQADFEKRVITVAGEEIHLTPNEYKLLQVLIKHAGRVVTQRQLLNEVWGPQHTEQSQYLRVYMAQLRRKLERDPARPRYLQTEPGVGYRLSLDSSVPPPGPPSGLPSSCRSESLPDSKEHDTARCHHARRNASPVVPLIIIIGSARRGVRSFIFKFSSTSSSRFWQVSWPASDFTPRPDNVKVLSWDQLFHRRRFVICTSIKRASSSRVQSRNFAHPFAGPRNRRYSRSCIWPIASTGSRNKSALSRRSPFIRCKGIRLFTDQRFTASFRICSAGRLSKSR